MTLTATMKPSNSNNSNGHKFQRKEAMCTVSVISDYGRTMIPLERWTRPAFEEYQDLLRRAAEFDRLLTQPHCEDRLKLLWMDDVEKQLAELESAK